MRKLIFKNTLLLSLFSLALATNSQSYACSCINLPTFDEVVADYDRILVVKLKKYRNFFLRTKYKPKIKEVLKGNRSPRLKPLVQGRTSCDPQLQDKQEWLVFLNNADKKFQPGWCRPHTLVKHLDTYSSGWRQVFDQ